MKISKHSVGIIHYTLKGDDGEVLDSSVGQEPLAYLQGHGNLIAGLEKDLVGKEAGDKFQSTVAPKEGYGEYDKGLEMEVPKSQFDGDADINVGMQFQAQIGERPQVFTVTEVEGDKIKINGNHALAGETLHFDVEVVEVRKATKEELEHGHVHGPHGHHHH